MTTAIDLFAGLDGIISAFERSTDPAGQHHQLARRIPNAELHVIHDGHLFLVTQAETIATIIMSFLSGVAHVEEPLSELTDSNDLCAI